jgi:hypothetical protein
MARTPHDPDTNPLVPLLKGSRLKEPPRGVLQRAILLRERLPQRHGVAQWLVQVLFDSGLQPVPAGLRAAPSTSERRILFEARQGDDVRQVDLRLRREPGGTIEVLGQCLPAWPAGVAVAAKAGGRKVALEPSGEFILRGVRVKGETLALTFATGGAPDLVIDGIPAPSPSR